MDKLKMHTPNKADENFHKLAALFPDAVTETINENGEVVRAIDKDVLMQEISTTVVEGKDERYQFTWPDKKKSVLLANAPISKTLRPCREESMGKDSTPGGFDSENLYIEGDNLEVLKLLQETYLGKVKMIYIDPPYNTGNDFVYEDDFAQSTDEYLANSGQFDEEGNRLVTNTESNGRFHTDWLNMIYPRLKLAKDLLAEDGVIFISIDDNEIGNLRKCGDEIFGKSQFLACFVWKRRTSSAMDKSKCSADHEYVLAYKMPGFKALRGTDKDYKGYSNPDNDPRGPWTTGDLTVGMTGDMRPNQYYDLVDPKTGIVYKPNYNRVWSYIPESMDMLIKDNRIVFPDDPNKRPMKKRFASELNSDTNPQSTWLDDIGLNTEATRQINEIFGLSLFNYSKPLSLVKKLVQQATKKGDYVLDFFSGSATTAHAVMQLNAEDGGKRKFIMVQLPEETDEKSEAYKTGYKNICEIGKERIRRAGKMLKDALESSGLFVRAMKRHQDQHDSLEGFAYAEWEESPEVINAKKEMAAKLDVGFRVFKLDTSNLETWDATPIEDEQLDLLYRRMNSMIHRVKPERTDLDMIYEIMLKLGVPLTYSVTPFSINNKTVYGVGDDCLLLVCLAEDVQPEDVEQMTEYAPAKIIISRDSFADDTAMANAYYILRDHGIELKLV